MAEEIDLDQIEQDLSQKNKIEERIKSLSEKVRTTAEERDAAAKTAAEAEAARIAAEKERDFYANYSENVAKYPEAVDFKDEIREKVLKGYAMDDAIVATLAKAGKFAPETTPQEPVAPAEPPASPAGGSAATIITQPKTVDDMTSSEKRSALEEALGGRGWMS